MATWKKVIVSGSNAQLANITASHLPNNGTTSKDVVVIGTNGELKRITQATVAANLSLACCKKHLQKFLAPGKRESQEKKTQLTEN